MALLTYFVTRTRLGISMRAAAENPMAAQLMGININTVIVAAFVIGSALAGVAGILWGARVGRIEPLMGFIPVLKAFVATVIGGFGSIPGAVIGAFILGFGEIYPRRPPAGRSHRLPRRDHLRRFDPDPALPAAGHPWLDRAGEDLMAATEATPPPRVAGVVLDRASGRWLLLVAAGLLALFLWYASSSFNDYRLQLVILVAINACIAVSLTMTNGFTGVFSLGQIGFLAIGAYVGRAPQPGAAVEGRDVPAGFAGLAGGVRQQRLAGPSRPAGGLPRGRSPCGPGRRWSSAIR